MLSKALASEKLKNIIIYFKVHTEHLGVTKLNKLLFFADFLHYQETGRSITGQDYFAWEFGPVPVKVYKEITGNEDCGLGLSECFSIEEHNRFKQLCLKSGAEFDEDVFTDRELKILADVSTSFADTDAESIVEISHHDNMPWSITIKERGLNKKIDYDLVFRGIEDSDMVRVIRERQKERHEVESLFTHP